MTPRADGEALRPHGLDDAAIRVVQVAALLYHDDRLVRPARGPSRASPTATAVDGR